MVLSSTSKAQMAIGTHALGWYAAFVGCATLSFGLLNQCLTHIPLGTTYAVWTGIGDRWHSRGGVVVFGDGMPWPARASSFLLP
ncbi:DMT family transporter [Hymenobacter sediminis]|uniref:DMT family transporter n=1 Tax=Hymenobacter sediminis TaxID=2218621 RepID=UPI0021CFAEB5|nr:SMR family transporter [Hymenobacter sediminis]